MSIVSNGDAEWLVQDSDRAAHDWQLLVSKRTAWRPPWAAGKLGQRESMNWQKNKQNWLSRLGIFIISLSASLWLFCFTQGNS